MTNSAMFFHLRIPPVTVLPPTSLHQVHPVPRMHWRCLDASISPGVTGYRVLSGDVTGSTTTQRPRECNKHDYLRLTSARPISCRSSRSHPTARRSGQCHYHGSAGYGYRIIRSLTPYDAAAEHDHRHTIGARHLHRRPWPRPSWPGKYFAIYDII